VSLSETKHQVDAMRAANIPLEGSEIRKWLHPQGDTEHATTSRSNVERLGVVSSLQRFHSRSRDLSCP